jgi:cryptochrome
VIGYNRMRFLHESLADLDRQLRAVGGRLWICHGDPQQVFLRLSEEQSLSKLCFEQDCEPIWRARDDAVRALCNERGIECLEFVSHTLWDPKAIIHCNGGTPPLTYQMFMHAVNIIGQPPRPVDNPDWSAVTFGELTPTLIKEFKVSFFLVKKSDENEQISL